MARASLTFGGSPSWLYLYKAYAFPAHEGLQTIRNTG